MLMSMKITQNINACLSELPLIFDNGLNNSHLYTYYYVLCNNTVTTDVQTVQLCQLRNNTYLIRCSFISGSVAQGCNFTLKSTRASVQNITGTIYRRNHRGVQSEIPTISSYNEVLAYDLEIDNTIGALPIRESINPNAVCSDLSNINSYHYYYGECMCVRGRMWERSQ